MGIVLLFSACGKEKSKDNQMKHYEIELDEYNFKEFLDYNKTTTNRYIAGAFLSVDFYEIKGVLSYAYYKNVVITFYVEYFDSSYTDYQTETQGKTYSGNFSLQLNAAGNVSFYDDDAKILKALNCSYDWMMERKIEIISVSGTVIFDI
ncbi:MAG: hypothetical protein IJU84_07055 [Clostridia bacterium]|nr:hypothetical protein [Clostridia bacterium]